MSSGPGKGFSSGLPFGMALLSHQGHPYSASADVCFAAPVVLPKSLMPLSAATAWTMPWVKTLWTEFDWKLECTHAFCGTTSFAA